MTGGRGTQRAHNIDGGWGGGEGELLEEELPPQEVEVLRFGPNCAIHATLDLKLMLAEMTSSQLDDPELLWQPFACFGGLPFVRSDLGPR